MNQYWCMLISDQNNSDFISFSPNIHFSVLNITLNLVFISSPPPLNSDNFSDFLFLVTLRVLKGNDQNVPQVELASFFFFPWLCQVMGAVEMGGLIFFVVVVNLNLQFDTGRWALSEGIRLWRLSSPDGISLIIRRDVRELASHCSLPFKDLRKNHLQTREGALPRIWIYWHLGLGLLGP